MDYNEWFNSQTLEEQDIILKCQKKILEDELTPKPIREIETSSEYTNVKKTETRKYYKINASDVAALIGDHTYKTKDDVFKTIAEDCGFIDKCEFSTQDYVQEKLPQYVKNIVESQGYSELNKHVKIFEEEVNVAIIKDVVDSVIKDEKSIVDAIKISDIQNNESVVDNIINNPVIKDEKSIVDAIKISDNVVNLVKSAYNNIQNNESVVNNIINNPVIKRELIETPEIKNMKQSVIAIRGKELEDSSTNLFEKTHGKEVKSRNTKCYTYRKNNWLIAGRVDGIINDDTILETKTRKRFWKIPPKYDIIQLRCYMKLLNKQYGILNDVFPDKTSRTTRVEWDETIWNNIEDKIDKAIIEFEKKYLVTK